MTFFAPAPSGSSTQSLRSRLRSAVAVRSLRHEVLPWTPPPARVASQAYLASMRFVANGNIYQVATAGTTAAGGGPTSTVPTAITDGTAGVYYMGPTFAADAQAPSLAISGLYAASTAVALGYRAVNVANGNIYVVTTAGTTGASSAPTGTGAGIADGAAVWDYVASAGGRFYRNASGAYSSGAATVISNDGWYNWLGSPTAPGSTGFGRFMTQGELATLEFDTDADTITLVNDGTTATLQIEIDGRYFDGGNVTTAIATGYKFYTLAFPSDRKYRSIRLHGFRENDSGSLRGVYCSANGTMRKPELKPGTLKGAFMGDSFSVQTNSGGAPRDFGMAPVALAGIGIEDMFLSGVGGSGFIAGTPYTDAARTSAVIATAPQVVIAQGSVNDSGATQGTMSTAINAWVATMRAALGANALLIITGAMGRSQTGESTVEGYMRVAIAALVAAGDANLVFIPASGDTAGPWTNTGNTEFYSTDNIHPLTRGYVYLGRRISSAVRSWLTTQTAL